MIIKPNLVQIIREKQDAGVEKDEIYYSFIRPIHYLEAAKHLLQRQLPTADKTAASFYREVLTAIPTSNIRPAEHIPLHLVLANLSLYTARVLLEHDSDQKIPGALDKIREYAPQLRDGDRAIVTYYFWNPTSDTIPSLDMLTKTLRSR